MREAAFSAASPWDDLDSPILLNIILNAAARLSGSGFRRCAEKWRLRFQRDQLFKETAIDGLNQLKMSLLCELSPSSFETLISTLESSPYTALAPRSVWQEM